MMMRIELNRDEDGMDVADIDGDTVTFRMIEFSTDFPDGLDGATWSMPLSDILKVAEAARAAK